jgi:4'-phosphopantetheinyl transferase
MQEPLLTLSAGAVHVWQIHLVVEDGDLERCRLCLSKDELDRARRFHFDRDRNRFIVARSSMKNILARYINAAPLELVFSYTAQGKPELALPAIGRQIGFNLSHSGDYALLAVARNISLGIDIEAVNPRFTGDEIAERFFSESEVDVLRAMSPEERVTGFFSCWTRKEAYIKALGKGLSLPLDSFDVAFGPGMKPALLRVDGYAQELARWSMYDIPVPAGYAGALVAEGKEHRLHQQKWEP